MGSNKRKYLSLNIIISLCTPLKFSLTPPSPDPTSPHSQSAPSQLLLPSLTQLSPPPTPSEDLVPSPDGTDSVGVDMPVSDTDTASTNCRIFTPRWPSKNQFPR